LFLLLIVKLHAIEKILLAESVDIIGFWSVVCMIENNFKNGWHDVLKLSMQ